MKAGAPTLTEPLSSRPPSQRGIALHVQYDPPTDYRCLDPLHSGALLFTQNVARLYARETNVSTPFTAGHCSSLATTGRWPWGAEPDVVSTPFTAGHCSSLATSRRCPWALERSRPPSQRGIALHHVSCPGHQHLPSWSRPPSQRGIALHNGGLRVLTSRRLVSTPFTAGHCSSRASVSATPSPAPTSLDPLHSGALLFTCVLTDRGGDGHRDVSTPFTAGHCSSLPRSSTPSIKGFLMHSMTSMNDHLYVPQLQKCPYFVGLLGMRLL